MEKKFFMILALLCAVAQGALAADYNVGNETELRGAIENGANITLTQDITISSAITLNNGITVTIDLGGHGVFSGSTLNISNGTLTGGWGGDGGIINQATLNMTNVTITGNKANDRGGGISNNGTLTMTDCTVSNNTSLDAVDPAGGGGIFNYNGKTATLTNCTITGNTASTYGGGGICNYGTMTLENCSVKNNNANTTGGGIFCSTTSTLSINGCDITGNSAVSYGDGIYIDNSTLNMQGLCKVTGNTDSNIYLYGSGTVITVTGAFTSDSNIGVGVTDYGRKLTSGYSTYNSGHEPGEFFSMDNAAYAIGEKDGEVYPGVPYWDHSWEGGNTDGHVVYTQKVCTDYTTYSSNTNDNSLGGGWYLLSGTFTFNKRVKLNGNVNFILLDGCNVEFDKGIQIPKGWTLTIYAQSDGDSKGYLRADGSEGENAAIGAEQATMGGKLVIHGGRIYAKPDGNNSAGIGGGNGNFSGMQSVTIYGGNVTAEGKSSGSGIGSGQDNASGKSPSVTIYGGTVTANGGNYAAGIGGGENCGNGTIKIYGGTVNATGKKNGAGIGGGEDSNQNNPIYIYGGNVTAIAGDHGAGIGGGGANSSDAKGSCNGGTVTIYGGTVNATGGSSAAGIGGGYRFTSSGTGGNGGTVTIHGGTVNATGGTTGAGIGGGVFADGGTVTINGGTVTATGGDYAAGIGGGNCGNGGTVNINGGTVIAAGSSLTVSESSEAHAIGHGCSVSNDGSLTLASNIQVRSGGTTGDLVGKDSRVSSFRQKGTRTAMVCDHSSITGYTSKDDYYHHIDCQYCGGEDEHHVKGDGDACTQCNHALPTHAYTLYEANAGGTGYAAEGTAYYVTATHEFTFPECSVVPKKMAFAGWLLSDTEPSGLIIQDSEDLIEAGSTITVAMEEDRTYYARYTEMYFSGGEGTVSDPFLISDADDWSRLSDAVKDGITFSGMYFQLTDNISVTKMVGETVYDRNFSGTFDGDGHTLTFNSNESYRTAPFRCVSGVTIKNLHVDGTITTNDMYAGGFIARANGTNTIENCRSSITINSTLNNRGNHGGFVAEVESGTTTIKGCVFDGRLISTCTKYWGGFVGLVGDGLICKITDCLFAPTELNVTDTSTFTYIGTFHATTTVGTATLTNCYYTEAFGTAQGTKAYTVTSGTPGLTLDYSGSATNYGSIKAYSFGLLYDGTLYSGSGKSVTFTLQADEAISNVAASGGGSLTGPSDGIYTLTMPAANVSITATLGNYEVVLYDDPSDAGNTSGKSNTTKITENDDHIADVTISGRKLWKDGSWNTLCLPFDVTAEQIALSDHPLYGATIMELDVDGTYTDANGDHQTGFNGGTLYLYFKDATEIEGGVPYIIKWPSGTDITDPEFNSSEIEASGPETVESADGKVSFIGIYDPAGLTVNDKSNLFLGVDNENKSTLYYPSDANNADGYYYVNAFRAYFHVTLSNISPSGDGVRAFFLHFGDDSEQTGITTISKESRSQGVAGLWYGLDGRKLVGKPTAKGVYIYKGKKKIIK